ncbi:hypothetical protein EVAR_72682_1 [Eumeta japonica]|uniref:Uncharacterized protein n=1 Tax=Eumeta variegata TaxID=151549 RepID=A0A4C1SEF7_EUMVA|nr:hypothetical protein EVAR_72682_1 [Eumeta japonica]
MTAISGHLGIHKSAYTRSHAVVKLTAHENGPALRVRPHSHKREVTAYAVAFHLVNESSDGPLLPPSPYSPLHHPTPPASHNSPLYHLTHHYIRYCIPTQEDHLQVEPAGAIGRDFRRTAARRGVAYIAAAAAEYRYCLERVCQMHMVMTVAWHEHFR